VVSDRRGLGESLEKATLKRRFEKTLRYRTKQFCMRPVAFEKYSKMAGIIPESTCILRQPGSLC
jgi:hypothetical protein